MKMEKRKIKTAVITGPTGAIGTALCLELAQKGIHVFAVCRPNSPRLAAIPIHPLIEVVQCDMKDLSRLPDLISHADVFYHFAWAHTTGAGRNDMSAQIENIRYTVEAVRAAHALGCQAFIGAGSQAEYGRVEGVLKPETPCHPESGYGIAKLCAGQMSRVECESLGMDHIWMRILSVYGPGDSDATMVTGVIQTLLCGKKPSLTAGEQLWDYLYAADAARAFRLIAEQGKSGKIYPLGGGSARPLREYVEEIRDAIDPTLPLGFGEVPYSPLQVMRLEADISALQADTGFAPTTAFAHGIRATIQYQKDKM
jgi:nucleoside-diphosphate-sugar epimerase